MRGVGKKKKKRRPLRDVVRGNEPSGDIRPKKRVKVRSGHHTTFKVSKGQTKKKAFREVHVISECSLWVVCTKQPLG